MRVTSKVLRQESEGAKWYLGTVTCMGTGYRLSAPPIPKHECARHVRVVATKTERGLLSSGFLRLLERLKRESVSRTFTSGFRGRRSVSGQVLDGPPNSEGGRTSLSGGTEVGSPQLRSRKEPSRVRKKMVRKDDRRTFRDIVVAPESHLRSVSVALL